MGNVVGIVVILVGAYFILVGVRGTQGSVFSGLTGAITPKDTKQASNATAATQGQGGTGMRAYMAHSGVRYAG